MSRRLGKIESHDIVKQSDAFVDVALFEGSHGEHETCAWRFAKLASLAKSGETDKP
jgi:hypothetical protein